MAKILMLISALILLLLGVIHLIYTFWGRKLTPSDEDLKSRMENVSPVITSETTVWKCWIGFNASHSFALLFFGLIYGYFAIYKEEVLFGSFFLLSVGFLLLSGLIVLSKLYWFSVPFRSLCVSFTCYLYHAVTHMADQLRMALGDVSANVPRGPLRFAIPRYLVIHVFPWPKGRTKGPPEAFSTSPISFADDLMELTTLIERFAVRSREGNWPHHSMFGQLTGDDWGVLSYRHLNHHLSQFGA